MADLLVTSLMADGGLEAALEASLLAEAVDADDAGGDWDDKKECQHPQPPTFELVSQRAIDDAANKAKLMSTEDFGDSGACPPGAVPLPQLVQQLLKNCSQQSLAAMRTVEGSLSPEESIPSASDPGISLLLQFQRLLLMRIYSPPVDHAAHSLLTRYITWLCDHAADSLELSIQLLQQHRNLSVIGSIITMLRTSITGTTTLRNDRVPGLTLNFIFSRPGILFSELIIGLILLEQRHPHWLPLPLDHLCHVLRLLANLIRLLPEQAEMEKEALAWPGMFAWTKTARSGETSGSDLLNNPSSIPLVQSLPVIRRAEFENHNKDGGLWLVIDGKVYDIQDFK